MRKEWVGLVTLLTCAVAPAGAQESGPRYSFGYAHLQYLGDSGGNAKFGLYLSIAPTRGKTRLEADIGYHHDQHPSSENLFGSIAQETLTIALGPRAVVSTPSAACATTPSSVSPALASEEWRGAVSMSSLPGACFCAWARTSRFSSTTARA
jgi:hypothetical protein